MENKTKSVMPHLLLIQEVHQVLVMEVLVVEHPQVVMDHMVEEMEIVPLRVQLKVVMVEMVIKIQ